MSPRDVPDDNISSTTTIMSQIDEGGEEGFVVLQLDGEEISENEQDESVTTPQDPNCDQSNEGYSLLSQDEGHLDDDSSESEDDRVCPSEEIESCCMDEEMGEHDSTSKESEAAGASVTCNKDEQDDPHSSGSSFSSLVLTQDHAECVRMAMGSFTLPMENVPAWANAVPEDEWLKTLTENLKR